MHAELPATEVAPAGHAGHDDTAPPDDQVPALHWVHEVLALLAEKNPLLHDWQPIHDTGS